MGHYAADFQCDSCGKLRCQCPLKPDKAANQWVVGADYAPILASEYEKANNQLGMGFMRRMGLKHYENEAAARLAGIEGLKQAIAENTRAGELLAKKLTQLQSPARLFPGPAAPAGDGSGRALKKNGPKT